jgi:hypothetical protein
MTQIGGLPIFALVSVSPSVRAYFVLPDKRRCGTDIGLKRLAAKNAAKRAQLASSSQSCFISAIDGSSFRTCGRG